MIPYNHKKLYINIVETKPDPAILIIETDCEVDFEPPLDYKEPEKVNLTTTTTTTTTKFSVFTGSSYRIDGKPSSAESISSPEENKKEEPSQKKAEEEQVKFKAFSGKKYSLKD